LDNLTGELKLLWFLCHLLNRVKLL
jgi:hypothetical protein